VYFVLVLTTSSAVATDHVWVVGGGPTLKSSQGQIELNVKWEQDVIQRRTPGAKLATYFASGNGGLRDVFITQRAVESPATLQPLARVFDQQEFNGDIYLHHSVANVLGSTRADQLTTRLEEDFRRLALGDRALFIFYGHGTYEPKDVSGNALRLWGNTTLSARQLEKLFSTVNPVVPMRFFLPQCYSGGFARLMHKDAKREGAWVDHQRCGFMSVAEDREAEGCSASISVGDFRDYTTYFFAALDGRTRQGDALPTDPDLNGDGVVTLREAHLYSLVQANSTDLPRSTSEVYLEEWQPWYLRWVSYGPPPANVYARLATQLAEKQGFPVDQRLISAVLLRRSQRTAELEALQAERNRSIAEAKDYQSVIQVDLLERWPGAAHPYTQNYFEFLKHELAPAQDFIMHHIKYADLVQRQERTFELDGKILATQRELAQMEKILRLRKLSRLLAQFERNAGRSERTVYQRLIQCEESAL
jgi:hypothetical protein